MPTTPINTLVSSNVSQTQPSVKPISPVQSSSFSPPPRSFFPYAPETRKSQQHTTTDNKTQPDRNPEPNTTTNNNTQPRTQHPQASGHNRENTHKKLSEVSPSTRDSPRTTQQHTPRRHRINDGLTTRTGSDEAANLRQESRIHHTKRASQMAGRRKGRRGEPSQRVRQPTPL